MSGDEDGNAEIALEPGRLPVAEVPILEILDTTSSDIYVSDLRDLVIKKLDAYYETVKQQATRSFWTALAISVVGFLLVAAGIMMFFISGGKPPLLSAPVLSGIAGLVAEFISAVLFRLYNRAVDQMKGYFDALVTLQDTLLSMQLVEDTGDPARRDAMAATMLRCLVGGRVRALDRAEPAGDSPAAGPAPPPVEQSKPFAAPREVNPAGPPAPG
jgi:hypothetical protein